MRSGYFSLLLVKCYMLTRQSAKCAFYRAALVKWEKLRPKKRSSSTDPKQMYTRVATWPRSLRVQDLIA